MISKEKHWWDFFVKYEPETINESLQIIKQIDDLYIQVNEKLQLNLNEYFYGAKEYTLYPESKSIKLKRNIMTIKSKDVGILPVEIIANNKDEELKMKFNIFFIEEEVDIETTQYPAVLGMPVKWKKNIKIKKQGRFKIRLPEDSKKIKVKKFSLNQVMDEFDINFHPYIL